jgi:hypothetical protein
VGARVLGGVALAWLAACGGGAPSPTIPPLPSPPALTPGAATGPTRIAFVSADPPPGSAVSGCGQNPTGCAGRVRMVFRLTPTATGTAQSFRVFLNSETKRTCFLASALSVPLRAGEALSLQVVLDPSDACAVPFAITDMAAVLEGTVELASRQEWSIGYSFAP